MPRRRRAIAVPRPEKPAPTIAMSTTVGSCPLSSIMARYVTVTYTSVTSVCGMSRRTATAGRLPAAERREQLLDVTKAMVAARGFHAVSIEAVAREAGVSRPIVYGHFDDLN